MRAARPLLALAPRLAHAPLPLAGLPRAFVALGASLGALADPSRADLVALVGETTGARALAALRDGMRASAGGAALLAARPSLRADARFSRGALAARAAAAPRSLGGAHAAFMLSHGFAAAERAPVRFVADAELAFVLARYRDVHDFWHVLAGLPPTLLGEVALKWFEAAATRLPVAALAAAAGPLRLGAADRAALRGRLAPWALAAAARAVPLLDVHYEELLDEPLEAVRERLRFTPAPGV